MKIPAEIVAVALIVGLVALAGFAANYWHVLAPAQNVLVEAKLLEYGRVAYRGGETCYSIELTPKNFLSAQGTRLETWVGGKVVHSEDIMLFRATESKKVCFDSSGIQGRNEIVEVFAGTTNLFFHVSASAGQKQQAAAPSIKILNLTETGVEFSVSNADIGRFAPISILVDNQMHHKVYPTQQNTVYTEGIDLRENRNNKVSVAYGSAVAEQDIFVQPKEKVPAALGLLALALSFIVFSCFVFSRSAFVEKFALSLASTFAVFILVMFALNYFNCLSIFSFLPSFFAVIALLAIAFVRRFRITWSGIMEHRPEALAVIALGLIVAISIFFHIQSISHYTFWNVFYERQTEAIVGTFSLPSWDGLSYLGRGNTFVPGYFLASAAISWLANASGAPLFAIMLFLSDLLLLLSVLYFAGSLKMNRSQGFLLFLFILMGLFTLLNFTFSPRHTLSLALALVALAVLIKGASNLSPIASGMLLGVSAFVQIPLLGIFAALYLICAREIKWRKFLLSLACGSAVFALLFAPTFFSFGLPYEIKTNEWGYLINFSPLNLVLDVASLLIFFLLFFAIDTLRRQVKVDRYSLRLLAFVAIGVLVELFVTFRWGMILVVNIAVLFTYWFPKEQLENKIVNRLLGIILLVGVFSTLALMQATPLADHFQRPIFYLKENTSSDANLLVDPLFGHATTYLAERKVLADLMVEYADEVKMKDSYDFLRFKDYSILERYGISYVLSQDNYINYKAIENYPLLERLEFRELDKVYSNGMMSVHWAGPLANAQAPN